MGAMSEEDKRYNRWRTTLDDRLLSVYGISTAAFDDYVSEEEFRTWFDQGATIATVIRTLRDMDTSTVW